MIGAGRLDAFGHRLRRPGWRGPGLARPWDLPALTQARARTALASGARYLYADCTVMSRVILEGCGMIPITTTVPYLWLRYR